MPGYVRKKTSNPGGRTACTRVRVKGKSYDVGCGMWNPVLNMEYYIDVKKSGEISDSLKSSCVDK